MTIVKKKLGSGSIKYVKYSAAKPGDVLVVGTFQGTELVKAYNPGDAPVPQHTFIDEDENIIKLNSAGQLNFLLKNVNPGALLEVVYMGKEKIKTKSGRLVDSNQFEVNELIEE